MLEEAHLVPKPPFAQHITMVGGHDDDRILQLPGFLQCLHDLADLGVEIGRVGVIAVTRIADFLFGHRLRIRPDAVVHAAGVRIVGQPGPGHVDVIVTIEVPEFRPRHVGVVRMDKADHHGEGLRSPHRVFQDTAAGEEGRLFIIFDLESGRGRPGFDDRVHVVIPLVDPLMRIGPVGRPGVVGGIDIGGEAFLEPVQLVRPHEMHLARQAGPVAHHAQVMGECGDRGRKLGGIVIGPDLRHQLPGHEARPRRGTKR